MEQALTNDQARRMDEAITREQSRLRQFIRKHVSDVSDAEDIFQEVFYELADAYRLMKPVEQVTGWLVRVARNRIIDLFRRNRPLVLGNDRAESWEDLLPSHEAGPEAAFTRSVLLDELDAAIDDLPDEQREVFVAHEMEGRSFKELSAETGVSVNTLLSRKHYAVLQLRRRLQKIYEEFGKE